MNYSDERVREFLTESQEHLDRIDQDIVTLERDPANEEALTSVFRAMHTMKGTCGFFGFVKLEMLAHAGEDILSRLRDKVLFLDGELVSALLALFDAIRQVLANIEATRAEGGDDCAPLLAELARLGTEKRLKGLGEEHVSQPAPVPAPGDPRPGAAESGVPVIAETSVRVDVGLLDKLMNLVGELVLARNQILQVAALEKDRSLQATSQRLNLITTEIQEEVMRTRLQRVGSLWSKFPRVVRDLCVGCGKEVRIDLEGEETELDRSIVEAIKAPLTHLLRNAVDHGIEPPAVRLEQGKPRQGRIWIRAFHENGQVNIHLHDDGAGIDLGRVKEKAVQLGLSTADKLAQMTTRELIDLVFLPGFSTAEKVTSLSGRGVGMDVVRSGIERVGGIVELDSQPGQGVTVRMKIPLTLAILPALIVTSSGNRYAIPQVVVLELVRLGASEVRKEIEFIKDAPVYRLRGELIPLVWLDRELDGADRTPVSRQGRRASIVVLQAEGKPFGLVVEKVNDTQEIVVKALGRTIKSLSLFAGATVMGDGKVALILDVASLARRAGVITGGKQHAPAARERSGGPNLERRTLLLFRGPGDRRMAIPLSMVARLEEFRRAEIELVGDRAVVQYRDRILPLIPIFDLLGEGSGSLALALERELLQVVVYAREDRIAGILVERILDIVEQPLAIQRTGMRSGVLGTMVLQGRVTEVLDVEAVIQLLDPGFFAVPALAVEGAA